MQPHTCRRCTDTHPPLHTIIPFASLRRPQIAVEEALRVREAKLADEVVAVSIGPKQVRVGWDG